MNTSDVISIYFPKFIGIVLTRTGRPVPAVKSMFLPLNLNETFAAKIQDIDVCLLFENKKIIILRKNPAAK